MKMDECMVEIKDQEAQHLKVTLFAREDTKCNTISFPDMDCKRRQWCRGWMGELVHWWGRPYSFINIYKQWKHLNRNRRQFSKTAPAAGVLAMGLREAIWRRLPLQLHDASGSPVTWMTMLLLSVEIQLTLEDSGSPRATSLGYSINDETCEVTVVLNATYISSPLFYRASI